MAFEERKWDDAIKYLQDSLEIDPEQMVHQVNRINVEYTPQINLNQNSIEKQIK